MDYSTSISTSYADTYDKTSSQLSDKLTSTDFSQASDDELMSVCKDFESYFVEQMLKSMQKMAKIDADDDDDSSLFSSMASISGSSDSAMSTMGSYFGDEMIKNYAEVFTESNNGKGLGIVYESKGKRKGLNDFKKSFGCQLHPIYRGEYMLP